jgi:hypothetical protein
VLSTRKRELFDTVRGHCTRGLSYLPLWGGNYLTRVARNDGRRRETGPSLCEGPGPAVIRMAGKRPKRGRRRGVGDLAGPWVCERIFETSRIPCPSLRRFPILRLSGTEPACLEGQFWADCVVADATGLRRKNSLSRTNSTSIICFGRKGAVAESTF